MTEYTLFLGLFILAYLLNAGSKTYLILLLAESINYYFHGYYLEYSAVDTAGIDLIVLIALATFGDIHKKYQISLLAAAIFVHLLFEWDNTFGTYLITNEYESLFHYNFGYAITIGQLLGAGYGVLERIRFPDTNSSLFSDRN